MNATPPSSPSQSAPQPKHRHRILEPRRWNSVLAGLAGLTGLLAFAPLEGGPLEARGPAAGRPKSGQGNLPEVVVQGGALRDEDAGVSFSFFFRRTGDLSGPLSVNYRVGGTATPGIDYSGLANQQAAQTLQFAAGASEASLVLTPIADTLCEPTETIFLTLVPGTGYAVGANPSAEGDIQDDDPFQNPAGLRMIETLPGAQPGQGMSASYLTPAGNRLFFTARDGNGTSELCWTSGQTIVRTGILQDNGSPVAGSLRFMTHSSAIREPLPALGNSVFFMGFDINGWNLWKHDGTSASLVKDFLSPSDDPGNDLSTIRVGKLVSSGSLLFFEAPVVLWMDQNGDGLPDKTYEPRLWRSDGTEAGTYPLSAVSPDIEVKAVGSLVFFQARNQTGQMFLWRSDGTLPGTIPLKPLTRIISDNSYSAGIGDRLFFYEQDPAHGTELWTSDGTPAGTVLVKDINPGTGPSYPYPWAGFCVVGNTLYFTADDGTSGTELWKTDGTATGTVQVADVEPGRYGSPITELTAVGNTVYFNLSGGSVWKSDGTAAGTVPVTRIPGMGSTYRSLVSGISGLRAFGNDLFFAGNDAAGYRIGLELWKTDGTPAGTVPVADIRPGWGSSRPQQLTPSGNTLFFIADDGINGEELWALDGGTPVVTPPVVSLSVSPASVPEDGPANLVFTFTRTGSTSSALGVTFSVGGTATEGTDYASLAGTGSTRTVTFAPGASTATVVVDPTADTVVEPDKTISLSLVAGTGYTVGSTAPVTGTITNDDVAALSVVSLAAAPPPVSEDGPEDLLFAFVRTGDLSQPLSVGFNVGGSAAFGTDYEVRGAAGFGVTSGTVRFAAGSSVALLAIDPLPDTLNDGDEMVMLSLASGAGYTVGSVVSASGTILDNDAAPGTVVRSQHITYYNGPSEASRFENGNLSAFAALKTNGAVVVWGNWDLGGDHRTVAPQLTSEVVQVFSNLRAFAALKTDGSVVTWGEAGNGGNSTAVAARLASGVAQVSSSGTAFAALKTDGSVVTWGNPAEGGDSSAVATRLASGVVQVSSTGTAFAALKADGSVVTWGNTAEGGNSTAVTAGIASGVIRVFAAETAFAALKTNGAVITWGAPVPGGDSSAVASQLASGVVRIFAASSAFAALKGDGSVVTWGAGYGGGNSSLASTQLASGVVRMFANRGAFAALKDNGSVVTWGNSFFGGDSSAVASQLTSGVVWVQTTQTAFAALKTDGSVVAWGDPSAGGSLGTAAAQLGSGTTRLFSNRGAFAALKSNGSVVAWGVPETGGTLGAAASQLSSGVSRIFASGTAFAALKTDGSIVSWGNRGEGGDSTAVAGLVAGGVVSVADPSTDDRLVPVVAPPQPPVVTLAVSSPSSVPEDGPANLVFTFTRTGSTTSALSLLVNIGGTAFLHGPFFLTGGDYALSGDVSGVTSTTATVTFPAGSATATVTADPLADAAVEADETVILTLPPGTGYVVGNPNPTPAGTLFTSATGTIANDDVAALPIINLAVSPSSVPEDGPANLVFTFTRTGSTAAPLSLMVNVGGTAIPQQPFSGSGTDYALSGDVSGFAGTSATVTFPAGSATATVTADPLADTAVEADETVVLTLMAGSNYLIGNPTPSTVGTLFTSATGTIANDDVAALPIITLAVSPASVPEDGPANLGFTFTRTGSTAAPLSLIVNVGGTAIPQQPFSGSGSDYALSGDVSGVTSTTATVTFPAGSATATVTADPLADTAVEADETVILTLPPGTGYVVGNPNPTPAGSTVTSVTGTIANDDVAALPIITLAVSSPSSVPEDGPANLVFTFTRTGSTTSALSLLVNIGGTAFLHGPFFLTGGDYALSGDVSGVTSTTATVTFPAGSATATVTADPLADTAVEADETVILTLMAGSNYLIGNPTPSTVGTLFTSATGTIANDDVAALPIINLAVSPASVPEDGTANLVFTFTRTGSTAAPLSLIVNVGGTAIPQQPFSGSGTDYALSGDVSGFAGTSATVTFPAGSATATVTADPLADMAVEADETVILTLMAGSNYLIGNPTPSTVGTLFTSATGTIANDETASLPVITVGISPNPVSEDGPESLIVTFVRSGDLSQPKSFGFSMGGTAIPQGPFSGTGGDYILSGNVSGFAGTSGSVTFAAGSPVALLAIDPLPDAVSDGDKTVRLTVDMSPFHTVGGGGSVTGTILDNDVAPGTVVRTVIPRPMLQNAQGEIHNRNAFAALRADGSVVTWGDPLSGGDSTAVAPRLASGVVQIFSASAAFAALKGDGSVVTWGADFLGGNSSAVASALNSGVVQVLGNLMAFAALKTNGAVVTWGSANGGGDSSSVASRLASGVTQLSSTIAAFAALKTDGSVVTWGSGFEGGNSSAVASRITSGVIQVFANSQAFAALKTDGSVVTWGQSQAGGDSSAVATRLASGITRIFPGESGFTALRSDGSVVSWGSHGSTTIPQLASGAIQVVTSSIGGSAALKADGSVVTWGNPNGGGDSSAVASRLTSDVVGIFSAGPAIAALKGDGSVVTWGHPASGGNAGTAASRLTSGVVRIVASPGAFAALKADGSVVSWGDASAGGDSSAVSAPLASGVVRITANARGFAALKADGSVVSWMGPLSGADIPFSSVASQLTGNGVSFADPLQDDRLVPTGATPGLPVITLTVSPASVAEDGSGNLVFTFARTGNTSSPLSVPFSFSGTATEGVDFAGLPGAGTPVRTAVFAAGASTTTVTIDPTADTAVESDETVTVMLLAGSSYTIGTTGAVVGTLANDDTPPVITLDVTPVSVPEDGSGNLVFTFTRTGNTSAPLSVSFSLDGTATEGVDFAGLPGTGTPVRTAVFAAGASTTTVSIDPTADTAIEPDETIALFIVKNPDYALGTTSLAVGTITNDDTPAGQPPTLSDATSSGSITPTSATLGAEVVSDGTLKILERGFLILPASAPGELLLGGSDVTRVPITGSVGVFSVTTTGLTPGTQYRFRAYATNPAGTRYSPVRIFQTLEGSLPVANGAAVSTATDTELEVVLSANDSLGKPLVYSIVGPPANGKLGPVSGNRVTYVPNPGFRGTDRFTFRVNNGAADSAAAEVIVTVLARPALEVSLSNPTQLTLGVRAPVGMRVILESLLPHADWKSTGQEVTGQGETKPVTVVLPIPADQTARLWRARRVDPIDPEPEPRPLPRVDVLVGVDASKTVTYTINGKLSPNGDIRVLRGGVVNFVSNFGRLTVTLEPVQVRGAKILFAIEAIEQSKELSIRIPQEAADGDEYKYSVILDDGKGNVIHHDPRFRVLY